MMMMLELNKSTMQSLLFIKTVKKPETKPGVANKLSKCDSYCNMLYISIEVLSIPEILLTCLACQAPAGVSDIYSHTGSVLL